MMMDILAQYGLFLLKVVTIVVAIAVVIGFATAAGKRGGQEGL
ncbi:MAG: protease SohB, partial [Pseudomonadota bacterium]